MSEVIEAEVELLGKTSTTIWVFYSGGKETEFFHYLIKSKHNIEV